MFQYTVCFSLRPTHFSRTASSYLFPQENKPPVSIHFTNLFYPPVSVSYKVPWLLSELVQSLQKETPHMELLKDLEIRISRLQRHIYEALDTPSALDFRFQSTRFRFKHQGLEFYLFLGLSWGSSDRMGQKHTTQQEAHHKSQTLLIQVVTLGRYSKHH